jgi:uncharacterized protein YheU (UPF0270 family)
MNDNDYVEIPWQKLSPEAFEGMLEELVSRDGTDYGELELSTGAKISQLRLALEKKRAAIAFCPDSESWTVIAKD